MLACPLVSPEAKKLSEMMELSTYSQTDTKKKLHVKIIVLLGNLPGGTMRVWDCHWDALVHTSGWEETGPEWFKEQCQTPKPILVAQVSRSTAPSTTLDLKAHTNPYPRQKSPCATLCGEQHRRTPMCRKYPQKETSA